MKIENFKLKIAEERRHELHEFARIGKAGSPFVIISEIRVCIYSLNLQFAICNLQSVIPSTVNCGLWTDDSGLTTIDRRLGVSSRQFVKFVSFIVSLFIRGYLFVLVVEAGGSGTMWG